MVEGEVYGCFFFQAEDGIRDYKVTGVQTCALPIFGRVLREQRPEIRDRQDHHTDDDRHRPRPHEEQEEAIDHERDENDLDHVRPEPGDEELVGFEVQFGLVVAPATRSASRATPASWTRNRRAPRSHARAHATAVARSRSSTGRPVAAPRNRLRDGPTATG